MPNTEVAVTEAELNEIENSARILESELARSATDEDEPQPQRLAGTDPSASQEGIQAVRLDEAEGIEALAVDVPLAVEGIDADPVSSRITVADDDPAPTSSVASDQSTQAVESVDSIKRVENTELANSVDDVPRVEVPAFEPGLARRQKWLKLTTQAVGLANANKWTAVACLASMLAGFLISFATTTGSASATDDQPSVEPAPTFVATVRRRHEPIKPVIPFDDLDPQIVEIGKRLFHDSSLSGSGKYSCASCHHDADQQFQFERPLDVGGAERNPPPLINAALNFALGWDGRYEDLESFLDCHFTKQGVMECDWDRVMMVVREDPLYFRSFQLFMQEEPTPKLVRTALANYLRSLLYVDSPFDRWLQGDDRALSGDAIAGYYLFKQLNCIACHQGAGVGGTMVRPLGELTKCLPSETVERDLGLFSSSGRERDKHVFRVPSLRNASLTAPYFHDGSVETLDRAIELMMRHQLGITEPNPVDIQRIKAFINSLSGKPLEACLTERAERAEQAMQAASVEQNID